MDTQQVKRVMRGRFGGPLRLAYRGAERSQVALVRQVDRAQFGRLTSDERAEVARRVTMTVKTFERPDVLRRCLASVRTVFDGRIVVADDSRVPAKDLGPGIDVIAMPFNSGVSVGRNAALDAVETEYVFVTDDDVVFTPASDIVAALNFLDDHHDVDLVALTRVDLPRWRAVAAGADALFAGAADPKVPFGTLIDGLPVVPKTPQLYLARTPSIQAVRWDERLRMVDHRDFFSRASGTLVSVQAQTIRAYHMRTPFDPFYNAYREDVAADLNTLARIWSGQRT
ncbi:glycosyltransferase family 2 protein [Janibacter sp. HTCC2649]|uniref:glycosyltransferase family 2 protein n=1 Tax=Janibacter sp. HTCC2649 TaxID=313589 RepID=UPI0003109751|nr:glycosyltransferase [Janibacter sp. HTCC2649]